MRARSLATTIEMQFGSFKFTHKKEQETWQSIVALADDETLRRVYSACTRSDAERTVFSTLQGRAIAPLVGGVAFNIQHAGQYPSFQVVDPECGVLSQNPPTDSDAMNSGAHELRDGLREYLSRFAFANATWNELIEMLDRRTDAVTAVVTSVNAVLRNKTAMLVCALCILPVAMAPRVEGQWMAVFLVGSIFLLPWMLKQTISYTVVFLILGALPVTMRTMYSRGDATVIE